MRVLRGLGVSPGILIGKVLVLEDDIRRVARRIIAPGAVKPELARFDHAVQAGIADLMAVHKQAQKEMGPDAAKIFLFHVGMLSDKSLIAPMRKMIEAERVTAEFAISHCLGLLADQFRQKQDSAFQTKVNDIDDLGARLLNHLAGEIGSGLVHAGENTILLAKDLTPSQAAGFDRGKIIGFATDLGGRTSHTAIIARALGIPAVVGCQTLVSQADDGAAVILDGDKGVVILNPDAERLEEYRGFIEQRRTFQLSLDDLAGLPSVTQDGVPIQILGNIEFCEEVATVLEHGGEGVGLFRTEFLFLTSRHEPTEKDHFNSYMRCLELLKGRPLTIRTVDLGADKYTQSRAEVPERNPFLGLRSIRYCLRNQPMFKRQLRAILRASGFGPLKVMFPLITTTSELRQARYLLNDVMEDLAEDGAGFDRDVEVGMMVEVPSAALQADTFAREVDFFSIGTNDLVQYTLAVDRTNERVAGLYNPAHPAVLRLIRETVRAARRHEIPVSCCGESASDPEYALLLIGLGLRTLSVTSSSIPRLKRLIRSIKLAQCERIARQAMTLDSDVQVASFLRDQARKIVPEAFDGRSAE